MPRIADKTLDDRILRAAQHLWRSRGEIALTIRAVAIAAGTTTTTVYKHFPSKKALQLALAQRVYQQMSEKVTAAKNLRQVYRNYLDFAEKHSWEYKLIFGPLWTEVIGPGQPRSVKTWLLQQSAKEFGGKPRDYEQLYQALFLAAHGAASLLTTTRHSRANQEMRLNCLRVCDALVKNSKILRRAN